MNDYRLPILPEWATDNAAAVAEPSGAKKLQGWIPPILSPPTPGEKPPAEWFNWLQRQAFRSAQWQRGADRRRLFHVPTLATSFGLPFVGTDHAASNLKRVPHAGGDGFAGWELLFDGRRVHVGSTLPAMASRKMLVPEQTLSDTYYPGIPNLNSESMAFDGTCVYRVFGPAFGTQKAYKYNAETNALIWSSDDLTGLPHPGGSGGPTMAYAFGFVWVGGWTGKDLYKVNAGTGALVATLSLNVEPRCLEFDGTHLWASGGTAETSLDRVDSSDVVVNVSGGAIQSPNHLAFDGETLWTANNTGTPNLLGFDPSTGAEASPARVIELAGNPTIETLFFDGRFLWALEESAGIGLDGTVHKVHPDHGEVGTILVRDLRARAGLRSAAFDGTHLWVVSSAAGNGTHLVRILAA